MTDKSLINVSITLMAIAVVVTTALMFVEKSLVWGGLAAFIWVGMVASMIAASEITNDKKDN